MKFSLKFLVACAAFVMAACDSDKKIADTADPPTAEFAGLAVLHASPDAPPVRVYIDDTLFIDDLDYKKWDFQFILGQTYSVRVDAILPGGDVTVFGPQDVTFDPELITLISAVGPAAVPIDVAVAVLDAFGFPGAGTAVVSVLHATAGPDGSLPVDVYVTQPPDDDIAMMDPTATFDFKDTIGPLEVPVGDYRIFVTPAGDKTTILYDSGPVSLTDADFTLLAAVPNVSGGPGALTLVSVFPEPVDLLDARTPTGLRLGHLSPDTTRVDVVVNGDIYANDVPFPAVTPIEPLDPGTYTVSITDWENPGAVAFGPADLTLAAGTWYSVLATDFNANLSVVTLSDDPRPVALYAKVRIYHAAPTAQDVDIYVTAPEVNISDVEPMLTAVPFGFNTGYLALPGDDYWVTVTPTGTKDVAIGPVPISIADGGVYTAIARDPATAPDALPGSMDGFGLIVLEDVLNEGDF